MLTDDQAQVHRIEALWMLLWPSIEERAKSLGAHPAELAVALTIGAPRCVLAASPPHDWENASRQACDLFASALAAFQGD